MKLRDRLLDGVLTFAVLLTLSNLLLSGMRAGVFVDAMGRPLGLKAHVECPRCHEQRSYILDYPVYKCRECGTEHCLDRVAASAAEAETRGGRLTAAAYDL